MSSNLRLNLSLSKNTMFRCKSSSQSHRRKSSTPHKNKPLYSPHQVSSRLSPTRRHRRKISILCLILSNHNRTIRASYIHHNHRLSLHKMHLTCHKLRDMFQLNKIIRCNTSSKRQGNLSILRDKDRYSRPLRIISLTRVRKASFQVARGDN